MHLFATSAKNRVKIDMTPMVDNVPEPGEVFYDDEGNKSTVLPDGCDPNYNPPSDELEEYAEFIGIDPKKEKELLWIALEGLRTPLPSEWRACQTGEGEVYYFNFKTGESLWDHPMDDKFKEKVIHERERATNARHPELESEKKSLSSPLASSSSPNVGAMSKREGLTKTITASLLSSGTPSANLASGLSAVMPAKVGRLCSLESSGLQESSVSYKNTSNNPDVSNLLPSSVVSSTMKDLGSEAYQSSGTVMPSFHYASGNSLPSHTAALPPKGLDTSSSFSNSVEMEKSLQQRLRSELEAKLKAEIVEAERQFQQEKKGLELALHKSRDSMACEWKKEQEELQKAITTSCTREASEINQNWERKMRTLKETINQREKAVEEEKNSDTEKSNTTSLEIFKNELRREKEQKVSEKRQELIKRTVELALNVEKSKEEEKLDLLLQRSDAFLEETKKKREAEKKLRFLEVESVGNEEIRKYSNEITDLKKSLLKLKEEFDDLEKRESSLLAQNSASLINERNSKMEREAELKEEENAQIEADEAVKDLDALLDAEMDAIEDSHQKKQRALTEQLDGLRKETDDIRRTILELSSQSKEERAVMSDTSVKKQKESFSASSGCSGTETIKVLQQENEEEEKRAMQELQKCLDAFRSETELLIQNQEKRSFLDEPSTLPREQRCNSKSNTDSNREEAKNSSSDRMHAQVIEKVMQQHLQNMKELDVTHEHTIRELRDAHHRLLASENRFDIRKTTSFTKLLNERKKAWIAAHPTPPYSVDEIPTAQQLDDEEWSSLTPISNAEVYAMANQLLEEDIMSFPVTQGATSPPLLSPTNSSTARGEQKETSDQANTNPILWNQRWRDLKQDAEARWKGVIEKLRCAQIELSNEEAIERALVRERVDKVYGEHISSLRSRLEVLSKNKSFAQKLLPSSVLPPSSIRPREKESEEGRTGMPPSPLRQPHGDANPSCAIDSSFMPVAEAEQQVNDFKISFENLLFSRRQTLKHQRKMLEKMLADCSQMRGTAIEMPSKTVSSIQERPKNFSSHAVSPASTHVPCELRATSPSLRNAKVFSPQESRVATFQGNNSALPLPMWSTVVNPLLRSSAPSALPISMKNVSSNTNRFPVLISPLSVPLHPYFIQCLYSARDRLYEQKHSLKKNQRYLESMRELWKEEMHEAKRRENKTDVRALRNSRLQLEDYAHRLNTAVLAVKLQREQLDDLCRDVVRWCSVTVGRDQASTSEPNITSFSCFPSEQADDSPLVGGKEFSRKKWSSSMLPSDQNYLLATQQWKQENKEERQGEHERAIELKGKKRCLGSSKSEKYRETLTRTLSEQENNATLSSLREGRKKGNEMEAEALPLSSLTQSVSDVAYYDNNEKRKSKTTEKRIRSADRIRYQELNSQVEQWLRQQGGK